jgi:hypothetical protein
MGDLSDQMGTFTGQEEEEEPEEEEEGLGEDYFGELRVRACGCRIFLRFPPHPRERLRPCRIRCVEAVENGAPADVLRVEQVSGRRNIQTALSA